MSKQFLTYVLLVIGISTAGAQIRVYKKIVQINQAEFNKHLPVITPITKPSKDIKANGAIRLKTSKKTLVFKDYGEMQQYKYEGELSAGRLIVIHGLEPNTEEYYLVNRQSGKIDTLFDKPIFYSNNKDFICMEGAGTDVKQRIQMGRIENGKLLKKWLINLPIAIIPASIYWSADKGIVIEDSHSKFHKLIL